MEPRAAARGWIETVKVRIAINSGLVVVGDIGSANRVDYTILGNTVNVTARLEELVAKPGQIVIGPATFKAVEHLFPIEHLGDVALRGLQGKTPGVPHRRRGAPRGTAETGRVARALHDRVRHL